MAATLAIVLASLTAANFGYQAVTGYGWDTAAERSLFQAVALFAAYWPLRTALTR